ncbi:MAG: hypothetical protein Pars2KO_11830 [Parasphingorhabdus sp.]
MPSPSVPEFLAMQTFIPLIDLSRITPGYMADASYVPACKFSTENLADDG